MATNGRDGKGYGGKTGREAREQNRTKCHIGISFVHFQPWCELQFWQVYSDKSYVRSMQLKTDNDLITSNVTGRHRAPKKTLRAGYRAPSWHPRPTCHHSYFCLSDIPGLCNACHIHFSSSSVVSRALSTMHALCVYTTFRHHPHPLGYPCAKFRFCCALHCWASLWRNIAASLNRSVTHLLSIFDEPGTKAFALENVMMQCCKRLLKIKYTCKTSLKSQCLLWQTYNTAC